MAQAARRTPTPTLEPAHGVNDPPSIQRGVPRLTVPAPAAAVHPEAVTDPVTLLGSVESLLLSNQTGATQWLGQQLFLLNRSPLTVPARELLLTAIQMPLSSMIERAQVLSAALGPTALLERKDFFDTFATLATEHAHAWKGVLLDHFATGDGVPAAVLVQALRALELEATVAFALYRSLPPRTWQEAVEVYRLADRLGNADQTAPVLGDLGASVDLSAHECLVRFLLLHLLLPQRLPRGGVWLAHRYLEQHARLCPFVAQREDAPGEFFLTVDLGGTTPRAIPTEELDQPLPPAARHLRLGALFALIREEYAALEQNTLPAQFADAPVELMRQVLRGMLLAWYLRPPRQARREPVGGWLSAVVGFDACVRTLRQTGGATPDEPFRCIQIDQSSNGLALEFHDAWPPDLQVGQLLLLQRKDNDLLAMPERFIAVVRRFVLRSAGVLMAGTERFAGRPVAVEARDQDPQRGTHPGLLLRRTGSARMSLLLPPGTFREHAEFAIRDPEGDLVALADKLLESNEFFERIEISTADRLAVAAPGPQPAERRG
jgi:hypothetical protein